MSLKKISLSILPNRIFPNRDALKLRFFWIYNPPVSSKLIILQKRRCLIRSNALVSPFASIVFVGRYIIEADTLWISSPIQWNFLPRCLFPDLYDNQSSFVRHTWFSLTSTRSGRPRISPTMSRIFEAFTRLKVTNVISDSAIHVVVEVCFFEHQCTLQSMYFVRIPLVDSLFLSPV